MGWVSCLEDNQKRLDEFLNTIQSFSTDVASSTRYELSRMHQILQNLQDQLVEVVTDPKNASKIELHELREEYKQVKFQNQQLRQELSEKQNQCVKQYEEIEQMNMQLFEIATLLQTERDIAEHLTTRCIEEQTRREKLEAKFKCFENTQQNKNNSSQKRCLKHK